MLSIFNIWIIARYEAKIVLRSWFFRIFSGIAILILVFINAMNISGISQLIFRMPFSTILKIIPASLPYINIKLLNIVQAVIAIFIASDFLKRDRKLDTTEVIYARSMTNADYVLGKSLGVFIVFIGLNVLVLLITALFHLFVPGLPFVLMPYLLYSLIISLPTLFFIMGLAYLMMSLMRSQAVTFIILLAYLAVVLFISQKAHYIYDYLAFQLPLLYSDFVGFAGVSDILFQRMMYLFFGFSFIFISILRLKRLIQSKPMNILSAVLGVLFLILALFSGFTHLNYFDTIQSKRAAQRALDKKYTEFPRVNMTDCNLMLNHQGNQIACEAIIKITNKTAEPIDEYLFSLNPGLKVQKISNGEQALNFEQNQHILKIKSDIALQPAQNDSLMITYAGKIDEAGTFLDVDDEEIDKMYRYSLYFLHFNIKKRISFLTRDYVLLTPGVLWYPVAGLPYGANYPKLGAKDFVRFNLAVLTQKGLTALSQGAKERKEIAEGIQFHFTPENPLPQLSLVIGKYERREITMDSVRYALLTYPGHNHFAAYLNEIGDTLGTIIRDLKREYEDYIGFDYPFPRLSLVEVPIQFHPYKRLWSMAQETMQPEMVFLAEQGLFCDAIEFEMMTYWMKRRQRFRNITQTPQELQSDIFTRFAESNFIGAFSGRRVFRSRVGWTAQDYRIFPNYYTFINHFESDKWPIFNVTLESSIRTRKPETQPSFFRMIMGLSDQDKCNLALRDASLKEILLDSTKKDLFMSLIENKGKYLFILLQEELGKTEFTKFLDNFLKKYRYQNVLVEHFIGELQKEFTFEFAPLFEQWYTGKQLAGYHFTNIENYKVMDGDRTRNQIKFTVKNPEPVAGLLNLQFWLRGQRSFRMGGPPAPDYEMNLKVEVDQTKEVGVLLDDDVRGFNIDTYISQNIPSTQTIFFRKSEMNEQAKSFQGERIIPPTDDKENGPLEIIVDNEDSGFEIITKQQKNWLQKLLGFEAESKDPYVGFQFWNLPENWTPTVNEKLYGKYIHSGYYIKSGPGQKQVAWHARLAESGQYEVYAYHEKSSGMFRFRRRGRRDRDRSAKVGELNFLIYHNDGQTTVAFDRDNAEDGWNYLDSFYFSEGDAKIVLTDQSKGSSVMADAVKWVKK